MSNSRRAKTSSNRERIEADCYSDGFDAGYNAGAEVDKKVDRMLELTEKEGHRKGFENGWSTAMIIVGILLLLFILADGTENAITLKKECKSLDDNYYKGREQLTASGQRILSCKDKRNGNWYDYSNGYTLFWS